MISSLNPQGVFAVQKSRLRQGSALSQKIKRFEIRNASVLEALLELGKQNQISFGIESAERQLLKPLVMLDIRDVSLEDAVKRIIAVFPGKYTLQEELGVVLIPKVAAHQQNWLDFTIRSFESRRAPVQEVSNLLFRTLAKEIDPGIKGFAGTYSPGEVSNLVGPLDERRRTLRELLCLLLSRSKGGTWVATQPPRRKSVVPKHQPPSENLARIKVLFSG